MKIINLNKFAMLAISAVLASTSVTSAYANHHNDDDEANEVAGALVVGAVLGGAISHNDKTYRRCQNLSNKIEQLKDDKEDMKDEKSIAVMNAILSDNDDELDDADTDYIVGDIMHYSIAEELKDYKKKYRKLGCKYYLD
ncbi:MAG: hypothetical protein KGV51_03715 [Moraxellaceae bacterium]|nr:hypothetical protein [Moraxellaceae bacterium]